VSLPWSGQQIEWLQAMGLAVLQRPAPEAGGSTDAAAPVTAADGVPPGLARAARGVDLTELLATAGVPRDAASRRAFWRLLRPRRKAARRR
jgi:hypothetical protein